MVLCDVVCVFPSILISLETIDTGWVVDRNRGVLFCRATSSFKAMRVGISSGDDGKRCFGLIDSKKVLDQIMYPSAILSSCD